MVASTVDEGVAEDASMTDKVVAEVVAEAVAKDAAKVVVEVAPKAGQGRQTAKARFICRNVPHCDRWQHAQ